MFRKLSTAAVAACALASAAVPAMAQDVPSRTISFADLDLSKGAGQIELRHRIDHTVREMCGETDNRNLQMVAAVSHCRAAAFKSADRQVASLIANAQMMAAMRSGQIQIAGR